MTTAVKLGTIQTALAYVEEAVLRDIDLDATGIEGIHLIPHSNLATVYQVPVNDYTPQAHRMNLELDNAEAFKKSLDMDTKEFRIVYEGDPGLGYDKTTHYKPRSRKSAIEKIHVLEHKDPSMELIRIYYKQKTK